jgi:hypothetical protein
MSATIEPDFTNLLISGFVFLSEEQQVKFQVQISWKNVPNILNICAVITVAMLTRNLQHQPNSQFASEFIKVKACKFCQGDLPTCWEKD